MIIARSPLRITLGGGGTDLASYYTQREGFLVAAAVLGWFSLALAAMLFVEARHKIDDVKYLDMACPWRWPKQHCRTPRSRPHRRRSSCTVASASPGSTQLTCT